MFLLYWAVGLTGMAFGLFGIVLGLLGGRPVHRVRPGGRSGHRHEHDRPPGADGRWRGDHRCGRHGHQGGKPQAHRLAHAVPGWHQGFPGWGIRQGHREVQRSAGPEPVLGRGARSPDARRCYYAKQMWSEAAADFAQAREVVDPITGLEFTSALTKLNRYEDALRQYDVLLKRNPNNKSVKEGRESLLPLVPSYK